MKSRWLWLVPALAPLMGLVESSPPVAREVAAREAVATKHCSPMEVAVLPSGKLALTANHTADSVSLVDLTAGRVLTELPVGRKPSAVACSRDGRRACVSNLWSDTVTLLDIDGDRLTVRGEAAVGHLPRGLVFAPDGASFHVALSGDDEIAQVDWATRKVVRRLPAAREPRRLALTRDGRHLVATCLRSAEVRCFDLQTGTLAWERKLNEAFNLLGLTLSPDDSRVVTSEVHHRQHPIVKSNIEQGWALNSRLAMLTMKPDRNRPYSQIAMDIRNRAVGDPSAVAFNGKGDFLAVAAAGTQEVIFIRCDAITWVGGEPGDFLDSHLDQEERFRRVTVGGRPLGVQFLPDSNRVVVANYLLDAVQVVDAATGKIEKTIALGGPEKPSLARRGEAIFYDAKRSHHHWFSCHTCHTDGHTNGRTFDTMNDDSTNTPKMTPTLRGVTRTAPYTWHGWQEKLDAAVEKSLTETLWGPDPRAEDVQAVVAFLATLDHPPNPRVRGGQRSEAAQRGRELFVGKARCSRCHQGEDFTSKSNYDVKLPPDGSPFDKWNPPSLRGVYDRGPYLHDGSADTLDEVLRLPHAPEKLGGKALTPQERRDLVEFLRSL
ncbi:MAG: c-type cytochrome [Gemmataceae bacterium]